MHIFSTSPPHECFHVAQYATTTVGAKLRTVKMYWDWQLGQNPLRPTFSETPKKYNALLELRNQLMFNESPCQVQRIFFLRNRSSTQGARKLFDLSGAEVVKSDSDFCVGKTRCASFRLRCFTDFRTLFMHRRNHLLPQSSRFCFSVANAWFRNKLVRVVQ